MLIAPLRAPLVLAKTAATVDVLSAGRLDLGVGVGWQEEEYAAVGVPWAERWRRLEDGLRACRALWRDAPATFRSETVRFEEIWCLPRPVQPGGIPLWFGVALGPRNLARITELGDGWMPMDSQPGVRSAPVSRGCATPSPRAGRDFAGFGVRAHAPIVLGADKRPDLDAQPRGPPGARRGGRDRRVLRPRRLRRDARRRAALPRAPRQGRREMSAAGPAAAPGAPPFSPAYARYVLAVLLAVYVMNFVDRQILAIVLDDVKRSSAPRTP